MGAYVELGLMRAWYDELGAGEPLVLLHPGMADARAYGPNIDALTARFTVYTPERRGHGRTPDVEGPLSFELMAGDTVAFMESVVGGPAHVVGCSDGATVALTTAMLRPDLVRRLVLIAGVFHYEGWAPGVLEPDNNEEGMEFLANSYAEVSPDGREHFAVVAEKMARMHMVDPALTLEDLGRVRSRTLVMIGDDDEVTLEHAAAMYRGIPDSELAVVPGTSHGLMVEKPALINQLMADFLTTDPIPTIAPIRRAAPQQAP
jgi:pimeloyl-ACP methyl ester carboxylesterase